MTEHERFSWAEFGEASRQLARQVARSGYRPDVVLGIARGGLLPAGAMAYAWSNEPPVTEQAES